MATPSLGELWRKCGGELSGEIDVDGLIILGDGLRQEVSDKIFGKEFLPNVDN